MLMGTYETINFTRLARSWQALAERIFIKILAKEAASDKAGLLSDARADNP
jgi:hypothetical protein